jgi:ankyrin repeat protein
MRNPDPGPGRYTSLAWAAFKGHEDIFDYLLANGHDDEELSKVNTTARLLVPYDNS